MGSRRIWRVIGAFAKFESQVEEEAREDAGDDDDDASAKRVKTGG